MPEAGVRFIAVSDGVDSECGADNEFTPFRNIINEWYAKDTGKKVHNALRAKGMSGKHVSPVPPYGYKKDPNDKTKWIIDEEAAEVVRMVFRMYINGASVGKIAKYLTENKIDTPQLYFEKKGMAVRSRSEFPEIWSSGTVTRMLRQYAYIGHTVNFKTIKKSFKSKKQERTAKEDWVIFENTQEAIIDQTTFDIAQKMRGNRHVAINEVNIFNGKVFCADCGASMTIRRLREKHNYFICSTYRKKKKGLCTSHNIREDDLRQILLNDLRRVTEYVRQYEAQFVEEYKTRVQSEFGKRLNKVRTETLKVESRIKEINDIIRKLYEDNVSGRISDERFDILSKGYEQEQAELKEKVKELYAVSATTEENENNLQQFLELVQSYTRIETLTPEILHNFIDRIYVGDKKKVNGVKMQEVKIIYNFVGAVSLPQN